MAWVRCQRAKRRFRANEGRRRQVIKLKGGAGFAVGLSIREVVEAIALDKRRVLPISSLFRERTDSHDVCLSVPTEVGCGGVRKQIELALSPKERMGLQNSGRVLRETIETVEKRLAGGESKAVEKEKAIPRAAWQKTERGTENGKPRTEN